MTLSKVQENLSNEKDLRIKGMGIILKSLEMTDTGWTVFGVIEVKTSIKAKDGMPLLDKDGNFRYDTKSESYKIGFYDVKKYLDSIELVSKSTPKPKEEKKKDQPKTVDNDEGDL